MSAAPSSLFDSLPARPPTPPREIAKAIDDAISFLDDSNEAERLINKPRGEQQSINASELTPSSSQDQTSFSALSKKVGFSPHPIYFKISRPDQLSSPNGQSLKRSPSSVKDVKPLKSILKLSHAPPPTPEDIDSKLGYFSPAEPGSFAKMLQSICQQLAGPSRSSRLDAYLALNGTLKAYENVPDTTAMMHKMSLLTQFLSRDITWKDDNGALDTQLISQALKLTMSILYSDELSGALDDDFRLFLLDRSILVLEQAEMPKAIVKLHLHLLSQQRFRSPVMNAGRADRILTALHTIEDRCSGNSVVAARVVIYLRLLEQAPAVMLTKARDWLEHVIHGMLSSINDIRARAIQAFELAGLRLGQQHHAGRVLSEIFETDVEEGQTYCDYLKLRLLQMVSDPEAGPAVPQIWSAVILFFRSRRKPLEKWTVFKSWLMLIQKCLNASDLTTRYHATLAWNKLVFAIMPDNSTSKPMMSMLKTPITSGMEKRGTDKYSKQIRQFSLDSYYNLLHYGLRPGLSNEELDAAWDAFVEPVLSNIVRSNTKGRYLTCQVLHGILNGNTGVWNANAAMHAEAIKPEDLPKVDPRWIRSRLAKVLKLLEPAIMSSMWYSGEANAALDATWHSLMQSIADAGSQEVKTTMDLKEAIALLVGLFRRVWSRCSSAPAGVDGNCWIQRYVALLDTTLVGIGVSPFTEDILATTSEDVIEVAPTPSQRPSKHHSAPMSPLVILFGQFYHPPTEIVTRKTYFTSASAILQRLLTSKATPATSLDLLARHQHTWTDTSGLPVDPVIIREMGNVVADMAIHLLSTELKRPVSQESRPLGQTLRYGLDVVIAGIIAEGPSRLPGTLPDCYLKLYDMLIDISKCRAGDGGVVLAVMEPFAKALLDMTNRIPLDTSLRLASRMLERKMWPKQRQSLEQARKSLWGVGLTPIKMVVFDPFEHVYNYTVGLLQDAYNKFGTLQHVELEALELFFSSVLSFLEASPISLLGTALRKLQSGFVVWINDSEQKTADYDQVANMIQSGWRIIIRMMRTIPSKDSTLLKALEPLLVAGFASPHRAIVNDTILFWNETFGSEQSLRYPAELESVLRARLSDAEITLPAFPESNIDHVPATLPAFFPSHSPKSAGLQPPKFLRSPSRSLLSPRGQITGASESHLSATKSLMIQNIGSPSPARRTERSSASSTPKPRLRHDDSQIQFAPIDSSPLAPVDESQLLTEHQKEVKARQRLEAQLFPDLSSSPTAQSTALQRDLPKRLDFGAKAIPRKDNEGYDTPTGLPDGTGLASDDIPSSPTPSSNKDASQGALDLDDDQVDVADFSDPPSSPPRAVDGDSHEMDETQEANLGVDLDVMPVDVSEFHDVEKEVIHTNEQPIQENGGSDDDPVVDDDEMVSATEFPSDSPLPTAQLEQEQKVAELSQPSRLRNSQNAAGEESEPDNIDEERSPEAPKDEISRIEDSFIRPAEDQDSQPNESSQPSPAGSRKRKRRSSKELTAKKRKPQSPFQRVWSTFGFGHQEEDEDDIGDEIVVASSRPASSPATEKAIEVEELDKENEITERSVPVKEEPEVMLPPPKRGRGRPRKSATPTPSSSQKETAPARSLKRKVSQLSHASFDDSQDSTSFVKDTPAPAKARRMRRDSTSNALEEELEVTEGKGRRAIAVVVHTPLRRTHREEDESTEVATPEKQLAEEQAAAVQDRLVLTPRSILGRLKDALNDITGMVLGAQEEREFDDVLFELRRETFEAGRRGRQL